MKTMTEEHVVRLLKLEIAVAGNAKVWALDKGIPPAYVSDVLRGNRAPGESILSALGLRYERENR